MTTSTTHKPDRKKKDDDRSTCINGSVSSRGIRRRSHTQMIGNGLFAACLCFAPRGLLRRPSFPSVINASSSAAFLGTSTTERNHLRQSGQRKRKTAKMCNQIVHCSTAKPIDTNGWPDRFPAKDLCSKCGLCESSFVANVTDACAFLDHAMGRIDELEESVHGRQRRHDDIVWSSARHSTQIDQLTDEARFGVMIEPMKLVKGKGINNAQWTGVVTSIALSMLESNQVDAVVCIADQRNDDDDDDQSQLSQTRTSWTSPEPIIARTPEQVLRGRGVKPALAPSLRVLDEIKNDPSIRRLLFCGVGCAVQAFRVIEKDLELDEVFVLGTNCADNSPTPEAANNFIVDGVQIDEMDAGKVTGYEFMQDFNVHVKMEDSSYERRPYFSLPGTIAEGSIAKSCRACFDYTNSLADVVVGYMGAPLDGVNARMQNSFQTLTCRNERGKKMVQTAINASRLEVGHAVTGSGQHEWLASATVSSDVIVSAMIGKPIPNQGMPEWLGTAIAFGLTKLGPKGTAFARYSIDYHILRNYLYVLQRWGYTRANESIPQSALDIVQHYEKNDASFSDLISKVQKMNGG